MLIDNASLLIAIAFSAAALMGALLIGWLNARQERYLAYAASGIALVATALAIMGLRNGAYDFVVVFLPNFLLLTGFGLIYAASRLFRDIQNSIRPAVIVWAISILALSAPLVAGLSGPGLFSLNAASAIFMMLCAREYWLARHEAPAALVSSVILYLLSASSFAACAVMIALEGQMVLAGPPENWAETFNSIMSLVGLTGIGAITLTLHHARAARVHRHEANTDSLTGVLNRRALFSQFNENDLVPELAVAMFDLDHFKLVNDRRGHAEGDRVLQVFAGILRAELRGADIAARLGGEEFCVVFSGLDREAAKTIAERIRTAFAALAIPVGQGDAIATVSAGLASGGAEETFASLLSRADAALYQAKRSGRNQVQLAALRLVA